MQEHHLILNLLRLACMSVSNWPLLFNGTSLFLPDAVHSSDLTLTTKCSSLCGVGSDQTQKWVLITTAPALPRLRYYIPISSQGSFVIHLSVTLHGQESFCDDFYDRWRQMHGFHLQGPPQVPLQSAGFHRGVCCGLTECRCTVSGNKAECNLSLCSHTLLQNGAQLAPSSRIN